MNKKKFIKILSKDYIKPLYLIDETYLDITLDPENTLVTAKYKIRKNFEIKKSQSKTANSIVLDGDINLELISIYINDEQLIEDKNYLRKDDKLTILNLPENPFTLQVTCINHPNKNTELMGLYISNKIFCTQCEPHGFRKIVFSCDRPDVMSIYTVEIKCDISIVNCNYILCNGNLIKQKLISNKNVLCALWHDPHPKPSYLFALVAGQLEELNEEIVIKNLKKVNLRFFTEVGRIGYAKYALEALKKAIAWDEEKYNRIYDLSVYMVVAIRDFNMGAMENKGLNIFNEKYILADYKIQTDDDYKNVLLVIAHEYFHNWTGNRITCRDWFQISLKEGLTVFREHQFECDMFGYLARIETVSYISDVQFSEDTGPLSHQVLPDSYVEVNNLYTATIYSKGAEIIRMLMIIVGKENFNKAMQIYFDKYDGMSITIMDFIKVFEDSFAVDLSQFKLWYTQSGTPIISIKTAYDEAKNICSIKINQYNHPTSNQQIKKQMQIPILFGLLNLNGKDITQDITIRDDDKSSIRFEQNNLLMIVDKNYHEFEFSINEKPILSALRDFSAPVIINCELSHDELYILALYDTDKYNRWKSFSKIGEVILLEIMQDNFASIKKYISNSNIIRYTNAMINILDMRYQDQDDAYIAELITLPSITYMCGKLDKIDIDKLYDAHAILKECIAKNCYKIFMNIYQICSIENDPVYNIKSAGIRKLKNTILQYIILLKNSDVKNICLTQYYNANCMTDKIAAFKALSKIECEEYHQISQDFYNQFQYQIEILDKWLYVNAISEFTNAGEIDKLLNTDLCKNYNPNAIMALLIAYSACNLKCFHAVDGSGYKLLSREIKKIDKINPLLSARITRSFSDYKKFDENRKAMMLKEIKSIKKEKDLSKDLYEIICLLLK